MLSPLMSSLTSQFTQPSLQPRTSTLSSLVREAQHKIPQLDESIHHEQDTLKQLPTTLEMELHKRPPQTDFKPPVTTAPKIQTTRLQLEQLERHTTDKQHARHEPTRARTSSPRAVRSQTPQPPPNRNQSKH
ncbi:hypothetical protein Droror1_Dr00003081 [Drosera rotundifolia]